MERWRYFGRTGGFGEPFEIYRIPANQKQFAEQSRLDVQRLRRDGRWEYDPNDEGIWREVFLGGLSEHDDELSEDEVNQLFQKWLSEGWPGRP